MVGTFTSTAFAQQFKEPDYVIHSGEILGFDIDTQSATLTISLKARGSGI